MQTAATSPTSTITEGDAIIIATPLLLSNRALERQFIDDRTELLRKYRDETQSRHRPQTSDTPVPLASMLATAVAASACTFTSTSYRHSLQLWRNCYTCSLIDSNGCCLVCATHCHAGHQLGEVRLSQFFCDCGAAGAKQCQALHDRQRASCCDNEEISAVTDSVTDFATLSRSLLNSNRQLFHADSHQSLRMRERLLTLQLLAKQRRELHRQHSSAADNSDSGRQPVVVRRGQSFSLSTLISLLDVIDNSQQSQPQPTVVLAAIAAFLVQQPASSLTLSLSEKPHYNRIITLLKNACYSQPSNASLLVSLMHGWLSVGDAMQLLEAVSFLADVPVTSLPDPVIALIQQFLSQSEHAVNRILYSQRHCYHSELSLTGQCCAVELLCESLSSTYHSIPLSVAASTTAGQQTNTGSMSSVTGVLPSLALSGDCMWLYALMPQWGLVKLGTGNGLTVPGALAAQRVEFAVHAGGHIVCLTDKDGRDNVFLRSPLLNASTLWRIDSETLRVIDRESLTPTTDEQSPLSSFEIEFDNGPPSQQDKPATQSEQWQSLSSLISTLSNLPQGSLDLLRSMIAYTDWKLGDEREIAPLHRLTLTNRGLWLIVESKLTFVKYRLRVKFKQMPMPIVNVSQQHQQRPTVLTFGASGISAVMQTVERCESGRWTVKQSQSMAAYDHELPRLTSSPSALTVNLPSTAQSPAVCDGCGLLDWRDEDCFVCIDGCSGLCLCRLCNQHKRFRSDNHSAQHAVDHRQASNRRVIPSASLIVKELKTGTLYCDDRRLVVFPNVLPPSTLRHWREFAVGDIIDVKDIYQKWYEASVLSVNPVDQSVMIHYHGWHAKWDEWIKVNADRFAPRGSMSSQNKQAPKSSESLTKTEDQTDASKIKVVRQGVRVLDWQRAGEHLTDVAVSTSGQSFICDLRHRQVWSVSEDAALEVWHSDICDATTSSPTLATALSAAASLARAIPAVSDSFEDTLECLHATHEAMKKAVVAVRRSTPDALDLFHGLVSLASRLLSQLTRMSTSARQSVDSLFFVQFLESCVDDALLSGSIFNDLIGPHCEILYSSWSDRFALIERLHGHSSIGPRHGSHLAVLEDFYYRVHVRRQHRPANTENDTSVYDVPVVESALALLDCVADSDREQKSSTLRSMPSFRHILTVYFSDLHHQLMKSVQPVLDAAAANPPQPRLAAASLIKILTAIIQHTQQLIDEGADSAVNEPIIFALLRQMTPYTLHALELVDENVRCLMEIEPLIQDTINLVVTIEQQRRAVESQPPVIDLVDAIQLLRESRHLTRRVSHNGRARTMLTPFSRQIFSAIFREFASNKSEDGAAFMTVEDFVRFHAAYDTRSLMREAAAPAHTLPISASVPILNTPPTHTRSVAAPALETPQTQSRAVPSSRSVVSIAGNGSTINSNSNSVPITVSVFSSDGSQTQPIAHLVNYVPAQSHPTAQSPTQQQSSDHPVSQNADNATHQIQAARLLALPQVLQDIQRPAVPTTNVTSTSQTSRARILFASIVSKYANARISMPTQGLGLAAFLGHQLTLAVENPSESLQQLRQLQNTHQFTAACPAQSSHSGALSSDVQLLLDAALAHVYPAPVIQHPRIKSLTATAMDSECNVSCEALDRLVPRLLESQAHWNQNPQRRDQLAFIQRFIHCESEQAVVPKPVPRRPAPTESGRREYEEKFQHDREQHTESKEQEEHKWQSAEKSVIRDPALSSAIEEPALCLSALFLRCLGEMGGGEAKRNIEDWHEAREAEKSYAAACLKHHGYTVLAMSFSASIAIVELLNQAMNTNPRIRCLSHPSCPQWLRSVVQSTFREVRSPLLAIIRAADDEEDESVVSETEEADVHSVAAAAAVMVRDARHNLTSLQQDFRTLNAMEHEPTETGNVAEASARMHAEIDRQSSQLAEASETLTRNIAVMDQALRRIRDQSADSGDSATLQELQAKKQATRRAEREMAARVDAQKLIDRVRINAQFLVADIDAVTETSLAASAIDSSPLKARSKTAETSTESLASKSRPTSASLTVVQELPSLSLSPNSQLASRRRRHSLLTIQPVERSDLQQLAQQELQQSPAYDEYDRSPSDEGEEYDDVSDVLAKRMHVRGSSTELSMIRSLTMHASSKAARAYSSSSLFSNWAVLTSRAFLSQPYDSSWIDSLVHSASAAKLKEKIQPAIERFHFTAIMRVRLLAVINAAFDKQSTAVNDHILPALTTAVQHSAFEFHPLHVFRLPLKGHRGTEILRGFYKRLVAAMNSECSALKFAQFDYLHPAWSRVKRCLHLFNADFLSSDVEAVVGSGIFAFLPRLLGQIDAAVLQLQSQSLPHSSVSASAESASLKRRRSVTFKDLCETSPSPATPLAPSLAADFTAARHLWALVWQTYQYLTIFYLSQQQQHRAQERQLNLDASPDIVPRASPTLRASVGENEAGLSASMSTTFLTLLIEHLERFERMETSLIIGSIADNTSAALDTARILLHFARLQSICEPSKLLAVVRLLPSAPPVIQQLIVQIVGFESARISPKDFDETPSLLQLVFRHLGSLIVATTSLPSIARLAPRIQSWSKPVSALSSGRVSAVSTPHAYHRTLKSDEAEELEMKQAEVPIRVTATELKHSVGMEIERRQRLHSHQVSRQSSRPPAASLPPWCLGGRHSWRGQHFAYNEHEIVVVEELILLLRDLCVDRAWRRLLVPMISDTLQSFPSTLQSVTESATPGRAAESWLAVLSEALVCLTVIGGRAFTLRKGAHVEMNVAKEFSTLEARPDGSLSITADGSTPTLRGIVLSVDHKAQSARIQLSYLPPLSGDTAQSARVAEFSFDQLRAVPRISPPNLNDAVTFQTIWTAIHDSMVASAKLATQSQSVPLVSSPLLQTHMHTLASLMTLSAVQIQSTLVSVIEAQARLAQRMRSTTPITGAADFGSSLEVPLSPGLLPSPTAPIDGSPRSEERDARPVPLFSLNDVSLSIMTSHFALPPSPSNVRCQSQPVTLQSVGDGQRARVRSSSSLGRSRVPVDYGKLLALVLDIANQSPNALFALSPFEADALARQFSHRLLMLTCSEIRRKTEITSIAARLSRASSRVVTRAMSRADSGSVTPTVMRIHGQDEGRVTDQHQPFLPTNAQLPSFPPLNSSLQSTQSINSSYPASSTSSTPGVLPRFIDDPAATRQQWSPSPRLSRILRLAAVRHRASLNEGDENYSPDFNADSDDEALVMHIEQGDDDSSINDSTQPMQEQLIDDSSDASIDETELALDAASLLTHIHGRMPRHASLATAPPLSSPPTNTHIQRAVVDQSSPQLLRHLHALLTLGFEDHVARFALARCGGHLEEAIEFILSGDVRSYAEYRQPTYAQAAFQQLVDRVGRGESVVALPVVQPEFRTPSMTNAQPATDLAESASSMRPNVVPIQSRFFRIFTHSERALLLQGIQSLSSTQSTDMNALQLYDWVDARDRFGEWFLAQVIQVRRDPCVYLVHFFGWSDSFNEVFDPQSQRLRPVSLIEATRQRLDADRLHKRVKVYGTQLQSWISTQQESLAHSKSLTTNKKVHESASLHFSDLYSFPPSLTMPPTVSKYHDVLDPNAEKLIGSSVLITAECVALLQRVIGSGSVMELTGRHSVGDRLMVTDTVGKLCEAEVLEVRGNTEIKIHYVGWPSKWDEWIPCDSQRIQTKKSNQTQRRRKARINHWSVLTGSTAQLIALVGKTGLVVRAAKIDSDADEDGYDGDSDMLVEIEAIDDSLGSAITFWSRLSVLKKPTESEYAHYDHSALVSMTLQQLTAVAVDSERSRAAQSAGRVIQSLVLAEIQQPRLALIDHIDAVIGALPCVSQAVSLRPRLSAGSGWNDSNNCQVGECSIVIPGHHLPNNEFWHNLRVPMHSIPTLISSITSPTGAVIREPPAPRSGMPAKLVTTPTAATSEAEQSRSEEEQQAYRERCDEWRNQRQHRAALSGQQKEKLATLTRLTELLLTRDSEHKPSMNERVVNLMSEKIARAFDRLTKSYSSNRDIADTSGDSVQDHSLSSVLSELDIRQLKHGQRVRLFLDHPDIEALTVAWQRTSQPSFPIQFFQCADDSDTLRPAVRQAVPNENDADAGATERSPSPAAPFEPQSCQHIPTFPPQLVHLATIPPLKASAAPIIVTNPCWVQVGAIKHTKDTEIDISDDDLNIAITPHHSQPFEATAFLVELILYCHRELRVNGSLSLSLTTLLVQCCESFVRYLETLHALCPWPSSIKARCYEVIAHLIIEGYHSKHPAAPSHYEWMKSFVTEAKERWYSEKDQWPLYSTYQQRCLEMIAAALYVEAVNTGIASKEDGSRQSVIARIHYAAATSTAPAPSESVPDSELESDSRVSLLTYVRHRFPVPLRWLIEIVSHADDFIVQTCEPFTTACPCVRCDALRGKPSTNSEESLMSIDYTSSFWPALIESSPRVIPFKQRVRLFDEVLNSTATPDRWLPEFVFALASDREIERISHARHATVDECEGTTFEQFVKQLSVTLPAHLRSRLGDITLRIKFKGSFHRGAEGLPGPFRQALSEVCVDLRYTDRAALFIECPNAVHDTGLNRNALILNPSPAVSLTDAYCVGQLMGIALRSQQILDLDFAEIVWKRLVDDPIANTDLASFDYSAWRALSFVDPQTNQPLTQQEFESLYEELTWTTTASDGETRLSLKPNGHSKRVRYQLRHQFAHHAVQARLHESDQALNAMRAGLFTVIPRASLSLLTWQEFQHRVCGDATIDLELLASRTVYAPRHYSRDSPVITHFWSVLESFNAEDRARFLQFCLARSRLPPVSSRENDWRMKINVLDAADQEDLPTAETCFFNLNLPHYRSRQLLKSKLQLAITHCSSINA